MLRYVLIFYGYGALLIMIIVFFIINVMLQYCNDLNTTEY